jgi:hypothetical protein
MAISLQRMDAMLKAHASRSKTIDPNLGDRLMEEINELTSACSMTGKAHDELHKWLIPFIELTADLQRATTNKERMKKVEALQVAMEVYHNYFD